MTLQTITDGEGGCDSVRGARTWLRASTESIARTSKVCQAHDLSRRATPVLPIRHPKAAEAGLKCLFIGGQPVDRAYCLEMHFVPVTSDAQDGQSANDGNNQPKAFASPFPERDSAKTSSSAPSPLDALAPLGFIAQLCLTAATVEQALLQACRSGPLWFERPIAAERGEGAVLVRTEATLSDGQVVRAAADALAALVRLLGCVGAEPVEISISRSPAGMRGIVDGRLTPAGSELVLRFGASSLARGNARADPRLYEVLSRHAQQRLSHLVSGRTTTERVREIVAPLPPAQARAYAVAEQLGLGVRTLHRRLRAESTTFRQVLDEVRMERCLREFSSTTVTAKYVAQQLGFADPASFHRAFKRWTGTTVRRYLVRASRGAGESSRQPPG